VLEPNAAGIDVGAREMFVAVPPGRDEKPVRVFATFTEDLERLSDWLEQCGVTTVALESTGVYWIPLFEILEQRGIRPCLVNARHMKNVPGRRTDWRRLYLSGRLGEQKPSMKLLPVRVSESLPPVTTHASNKASTSIEVANPKPVARFTSNCGRHSCVSKALLIQGWFACCWSASRDDCSADQNADLDRSGCHGLAPGNSTARYTLGGRGSSGLNY